MKSKRILLIAILLTGIISGFIFKLNNDWKNGCSIETKGQIQVQINNNADKEISSKYLADIDSLPSFLTSFSHTIVIQKEKSEPIEGIKGTILMYTQANKTYVCTDYYDETGIIHEMFHGLDYNLNFPSRQDEFGILYEKYKEQIPVSAGNIENQEEFFASCGEIFVTAPESLKEKGEELYLFFENLTENWIDESML